VLTVNGKPLETLRVKRNERLRLRLCCTTNARILRLAFDGFDAHLVAVDGQPVPPRKLSGYDVGLASGQRIDIIADMTGGPGTVATISEISDLRLPVVHMVHDAEKTARPEPLASVEPLPDNPLRPLKAEPDQTVELRMSGGAMGGMRSASFKGETLDLRTLARQHGLIWAFNGVAGMPDKPLFVAERGQTVAVRMVNETRWPHAMHLHGHHVQITHRSGRGPKQRYWRDTVLVQPREKVTMTLVADNPGKWMIHCHMLEHQAGGMMTWFEVAA
jgi:FtsP/CotA-like multicopper oxidase with cupredoxin domain